MSDREAATNATALETLRDAIADARASIDETGRIADEAIADATKLSQQSSHIELKSPPSISSS